MLHLWRLLFIAVAAVLSAANVDAEPPLDFDIPEEVDTTAPVPPTRTEVIVILRHAGAADRESRLLITGGENVVDALRQIGGLAALNRKKLWIERSVPGKAAVERLEIDWDGISRRGYRATNYTLLAGDRLIIADRDPGQIDMERMIFLCAAAMPATLFGLTLFVSLLVSMMKRAKSAPHKSGELA